MSILYRYQNHSGHPRPFFGPGLTFTGGAAISEFYLVRRRMKDYEHPAPPLRVLPFQTFVKELELP